MRLLAFVTLTAASVLVASQSEIRTPRSPAWVADRVERWQPTAGERRWEMIGWAKDIRDAQALASRTQRPVFLYTLDGRMAVGRC